MPKTRSKTGTTRLDASVKWVKAESGILRVAEEARDVLMDIHNGQPLGIVTVVGSARQGKSFLMNALTGSDTVFHVSPEVHPCTAGADLSPHLMPLSKFKSMGSNYPPVPPSASSSDPMIGFVDMEGQGDQSNDRDVRLATPFLLVSQVVIFNWMGLPNKNTILQRLAVMIKAADKVAASREDTGKSKFGHLILLVRDVKGRAGEIEALVMGNENTGALSLRESKDALERNTIREGLKDAFRSITVHTMPRPHPDISDGAVPLTEVSPDFTASLDELRNIIGGHLSTPHTFGGQPVTGGQRVHDIVRGLCDAVNSTEEICPPSVLEAIDTRRAREETQKALGLFERRLEEVTSKSGPVRRSEEVTTAIDNTRYMVFELFDEATQGICGRILKGARADLLKQISLKSTAVAGIQEGKRRDLTNKLQALVSKSEADVTQRALQWHTTEAQGIPAFMLQQKWNHLVSMKYGTLDRELKKMATVNGVTNIRLLNELGWALSRAQFEGLLTDTYQRVQNLNRTALAREEDRKAKEEAERRAARLAEENERLERERRDADRRRQEAEDLRRREAQEEANRRSHYDLIRALEFEQQMYCSYPVGGRQRGRANRAGGRQRADAGGLRFYRGGVFIPGGGRAPAGGVWM